jgi:hypothetical protein
VTALRAYIDGVGLIAPGIDDWPAGARVLAGEAPWTASPTRLPAPDCLPAAERRRSSAVVRLALAAGLEACRHAGADAAQLPAVFSSSGGDGQNCDEICRVLASSDRQLSPTRFHNSVHNAAAGYWGIATGATPPANALCAYDASFAAGLIEALTQLVVEKTKVLLIAYDTPYPEPMRRVRQIPDAFATSLVLCPTAGAASQALIEASLGAARGEQLPQANLEALREAVPAARSLPLLAMLARRAGGTCVLDYLDTLGLHVRVSPCR